VDPTWKKFSLYVGIPNISGHMSARRSLCGSSVKTRVFLLNKISRQTCARVEIPTYKKKISKTSSGLLLCLNKTRSQGQTNRKSLFREHAGSTMQPSLRYGARRILDFPRLAVQPTSSNTQIPTPIGYSTLFCQQARDNVLQEPESSGHSTGHTHYPGGLVLG